MAALAPDYWRRLKNLSREPGSIILSKLTKKIRLATSAQYLNALRLFGISSKVNSWRLAWLLKPSVRKNDPTQLPVIWPFWPIEEKSDLIKIIQEKFPQHAEAITVKAQEYLAGRYRFLEAHSRDLKTLSLSLARQYQHEPTYLPWHYDWVKPYRWDPKKNYLACEYESLDGIDVKLPWELSRMSHLVILAQAYLLTQDQRLADEVAIQISDWWKHNPPGYGVNWACSMDTGLRAANVAMALGLLGGEFLKTHESLAQLLPGFFYHHAAHIIKNLELPTNHLLGDLIGVAFVSRCYPYFQASENWSRWAHEALVDQMQYQILDDGMDFEGSSSYHRLVSEFFLAHRLLYSDQQFPQQYIERWQAMMDGVDCFIKPDGQAVQIGDNDSGRLWALAPERSLMDFGYLTCLGALALGHLKAPSAEQYAPEALWLLGPKNYLNWSQENLHRSLTAKGVKFGNLPKAGIYFVRDQKRGHYLSVKSSPQEPPRSSGHFHNDRFSFHLMINKEDIFVDPGTGVYLRNRGQRDELRSTRSHNTLILDDQEQQNFDGPFSLAYVDDQTNVRQWGFDQKTGLWHWIGQRIVSICGDLKIQHERVIRFQTDQPSSQLTVIDRVSWAAQKHSSEKAVPLQWSFILSPDVSIVRAGGGEVLMKTLQKRQYSLKGSIPIEVVDGLYSPEFGIVMRTNRLKASLESPLPVNLEFVFQESGSLAKDS